MTDLPWHPDVSDRGEPGRRRATNRPRWAYALAVLVVALLVLMVVLHLTGVMGPGSH